MDSRIRSGDLIIALICAMVSAALTWGATGLQPRWWMMWIALLPLLWFAGRRGGLGRWHGLVAAAAAFLAWFGGNLNTWSFLHGLIQLPLGVILPLIVIPAIIVALGVLLWRRLLVRGRIAAAVLFLPAYWVSIEYLNALTSPHSTWANLAYTQSDVLPLIQIAAVTGIWGISFVLFLVVSTLGVLLSEFGTRQQKQRVAIAVGVAVAMVFAFGAWRLATPLDATGTLNVRLVSNDRRGDTSARDDAGAMRVLTGYADTISASAATAASATSGTSAASSTSTKADFIIVPEKLVPVSDAAAPGAKALFENAARRADAHLVVGLDEARQGMRRNEALVFDHTGAITIDYEKHHFIPVLEDGYVLGTTYDTWPTPKGTLGVAICKDMDFPPLGREYGSRGIGLLFVPAWDFNVDGWYHSRMAILRGVESGFSIARVAKQGLHTVTDNRGRLLVDRPGSRDGFVISDTIVPIAHADTIYTRWGDWFAWVTIAGLAWTLAMAFIRAR
jgi:apolipoprotein N-acyltransferase